MTDRLFTAYQVADLLGVTPTEVAQWIQKGWLPYQRLPEGPVRIREKGLIQFLRDRGIDLEAILAKAVVSEQQKQSAAGAATPKVAAHPIEIDRFAQAPAFDWSALPAAAEVEPKLRPEDTVDVPSLPPSPTNAAAEEEVPPSQPEPTPIPAPVPVQTPPPAYESVASTTDAASGLEELIADALSRRAGQVLLQQVGTQTAVRLRIDGLWCPSPRFGRLSAEMSSRLSGQLDALGCPRAGKASFRTRLGGQDREFELVSVPTPDGRRISIDLLHDTPPLELDDLAISADLKRSLQEMTDRSTGMIVFAGPPGSGRHTLIYALGRRLEPLRDVVALGPYRRNAGLTQIDAGDDAAAALDLAISQRPDVLVLDCANQALLERASAAAGQCIVLAACEDRTWSSLAERLSRLSPSPWRPACVDAVVQQRLVRRLCPHCRAPITAQEEAPLLESLGLGTAVGGFKAGGCSQCSMTGYAGRLLIDHLILGDTLQQALAQPQNPETQHGLLYAGLEKVRQGVTSLADLVRGMRM